MKVLVSMLCLLVSLSFIGCVTTPTACPPCPNENMLLWYPDGSCPMKVPKGYFDSDEYSADDTNINDLYEKLYGIEPEEDNRI